MDDGKYSTKYDKQAEKKINWLAQNGYLSKSISDTAILHIRIKIRYLMTIEDNPGLTKTEARQIVADYFNISEATVTKVVYKKHTNES